MGWVGKRNCVGREGSIDCIQPSQNVNLWAFLSGLQRLRASWEPDRTPAEDIAMAGAPDRWPCRLVLRARVVDRLADRRPPLRAGRREQADCPPPGLAPSPERTPHTACEKIAKGTRYESADQVATSCGFHRPGPREKELPARRQRRGRVGDRNLAAASGDAGWRQMCLSTGIH